MRTSAAAGRHGRPVRCPGPLRISTLVQVVLQKFHENKFIDQLANWEFDISEFGRVTAEQIPGLLKTTVLVIKTGCAMYRYLCMHIISLATYQ